ncbi:putative integral membrane protein [Streptomyces himastatinicus ATCC 53653]|uniref:Putative integral membrane protein n=1 Tax=Streptomyces himastatinicus ATCC 53653 TaxID=457427 RepID=D9WI18_9ACTN|nr:putative integral membrane protein [Streptomyces himastatinicus ATCC 53653]
MIRDQEETAKQQGAQPPEEEARTPEALPRSDGSDGTGGPHGPQDHGGAENCGDPGDPDGPQGHNERVSGDEPLLPARVHRPSDLMRLLLGALGIGIVLAVAAFAHGTTAGLEKDIGHGANQAPPLMIDFAGLTASIAVLVLPVAFAIERLVKRDGLRIADGVLAAVLAHGISLATDLWVARAAPDSIREALTQTAPGGALSDPVHGYLAPVIAYMTAVGMARRPRWRVAMWGVLLLDAFAVLVGGYTTPFSIIITVLIGWTVAYGTLYAVGSFNVRPTGQHLLAGLRRVGFNPVSAARAEEAVYEHGNHSDRGRRYLVTLEDGPPLVLYGGRPLTAGPGLLLQRLAAADAAHDHPRPAQPPVAAPGAGAGGAARVRGDRGGCQRAQADRHLRAGPGRRDAHLRAHRRPSAARPAGRGDHR